MKPLQALTHPGVIVGFAALAIGVGALTIKYGGDAAANARSSQALQTRLLQIRADVQELRGETSRLQQENQDLRGMAAELRVDAENLCDRLARAEAKLLERRLALVRKTDCRTLRTTASLK